MAKLLLQKPFSPIKKLSFCLTKDTYRKKEKGGRKENLMNRNKGVLSFPASRGPTDPYRSREKPKQVEG